MESARKKKTITKNEPSLDLFSIFPLDLVVEILMKLPAKSLARFTFVSKHWSSIIRSKDFIKLYMTRSSTMPRFLFVGISCNMQPQFFESCSQEDPFSDHKRVNITPHPNEDYNFTLPIRGLICRQNDTRVMVGNPTTGQFLTLPRVKTRRIGLISFSGYDHVSDVYKVLCMTVPRHGHQGRKSLIVSDEHQVFTLGPQQKWRKISCKHPHLPPPNTKGFKGICINGVVYYYAWIKSEGTLICFDLTSEDFNVVKLPENGVKGLVNYGGKLALCRQTMLNAGLDLWVLQDAKKQEWSKVSHLVPSWTDLVGFNPLGSMAFEGTLSTGQLIFAPLWLDSHYPYFLISYDLKENNAKKVVIEGIKQGPYIQFYFDHVENPIVLSNVS